MTTARENTSEFGRARALAELLQRRGADVVAAWVQLQAEGGSSRGAVDDVESLTVQSEAIIEAIRTGLVRSGRVYDASGPEFESLRALIGESSRRGAREGATPSETAHGVLALREALITVTQSEQTPDLNLEDAIGAAGRLVDALALLTFEIYVRGREDIIRAQHQQLSELSTPVVRLWDGIIAVPLIGTLDSNRAQIVMESLLQAIVDENAQVAILDITGVPTVDTLVAQNLLKTVTATRLMGAECIISGIRPQTAQTIVQLGIDLAEITTRATLADALRMGIRLVERSSRDAAPTAGA